MCPQAVEAATPARSRRQQNTQHAKAARVQQDAQQNADHQRGPAAAAAGGSWLALPGNLRAEILAIVLRCAHYLCIMYAMLEWRSRRFTPCSPRPHAR